MIAFLVTLIILSGIVGVLILIMSSNKKGGSKTEPTVISSGTGEDLISGTEVDEKKQTTQTALAPALVPDWARGVERALTGDEPVLVSDAKQRGMLAQWFSNSIKGREIGLKAFDMQTLTRAAKKLGIPPDVDILQHMRALDRVIQFVLWQNIKVGTLADANVEDLLFRLMYHRQNLELGRPRYRAGIMSTRSLTSGQPIKIMVQQAGMFKSYITRMQRQHIEFELPKGRSLPNPLQWKGLKIECYFWRKDDAGYFFESQVQNNPDKTMNPILFMNHSDSLIRTQKRASLRAKVFQDAVIVPLRSMSDANEMFSENAGFKCRLIDLSEMGAAVLVRGKIDPGFLVKVQVRLGGLPIVLPGEIKSVTVNEEKGFSVLHVQALPISKAMRIRILAHVLGITLHDATVLPLSGGPARKPSAQGDDGDVRVEGQNPQNPEEFEALKVSESEPDEVFDLGDQNESKN